MLDSPFSILLQAKCKDVKEEEHMVSTAKLGPCAFKK